jgi:hypothetical protein
VRPIRAKRELQQKGTRKGSKFIGEIVAGKDPRKAPAPPVHEETTVADFVDQYYERYVVAESRRSVASIRSDVKAMPSAASVRFMISPTT